MKTNNSDSSFKKRTRIFFQLHNYKILDFQTSVWTSGLWHYTTVWVATSQKNPDKQAENNTFHGTVTSWTRRVLSKDKTVMILDW